MSSLNAFVVGRRDISTPLSLYWISPRPRGGPSQFSRQYGTATDDIVQQTMLKALLHADQFRFESSLRTWLTSIAKNELRQLYRSKWQQYSFPLILENLESDRSLQVESASLKCEVSEREVLIRQAVSRLPATYRSVVELCDLQGLRLEEAATRLRLTLPAIKTRRRRARIKLRLFVANLKNSTNFPLKAVQKRDRGAS
jgi:RNA polymerase sigma-70 factor, ECF subfamily